MLETVLETLPNPIIAILAIDVDGLDNVDDSFLFLFFELILQQKNRKKIKNNFEKLKTVLFEMSGSYWGLWPSKATPPENSMIFFLYFFVTLSKVTLNSNQKMFEIHI